MNWRWGKCGYVKGKYFFHNCQVLWEALQVYPALLGKGRELGWVSLDFQPLSTVDVPPTLFRIPANTRPCSPVFQSLSQSLAHCGASPLASRDWTCHFPSLCLVPLFLIITRTKHWHYCFMILFVSLKITFVKHGHLSHLWGCRAHASALFIRVDGFTEVDQFIDPLGIISIYILSGSALLVALALNSKYKCLSFI